MGTETGANGETTGRLFLAVHRDRHRAQDAKCIATQCTGQSFRCALDSKCRSALGCLATTCAPPCSTKNVTQCNLSECMVVDGKCAPSPKCTLRCFDEHTQYGNKPFNNLIECMFGKNCSAQMIGDWPKTAQCVPPPAASVVPKFNISDMEGMWYITRGLSEEFDTYNCQVACNRRVASDRVNLSIWYRISMDDGTELQQNSNQSFFNPDASMPAHLRQNAWMDGQDNWYVIGSRSTGPISKQYWFVKYCGCNDTWCGYGGGFVYTKTATLDEELIPELTEAARRAGFNFTDMKTTKNQNCGIKPTHEYGC